MENQLNWQPIQNLPIIGNLIDGQFADAKEQYVSLLEARNKPHVLNDAIIQRTIHIYYVLNTINSSKNDRLWYFTYFYPGREKYYSNSVSKLITKNKRS
ncbi:hypothetical protein ACS52_09010 [Bacillus cereus]|nr:hypothetical protein ACS52_09010 [Bacillus cereus]